MLYDYRYKTIGPLHCCFRFCPDKADLSRPYKERSTDAGQVLAWVLLNDKWYGPFYVNLPTHRGAFAQNPAQLVGPEQFALKAQIRQRRNQILDSLKPLYALAEAPDPGQVRFIFTTLFPTHEPVTFC